MKVKAKEKEMYPKILLNILTHGNETIGISVAKELEKLNIDKKYFKVNIANQKAYEMKKSFIDSDLNRVFPGDENGDYEHKLAAKLLPLIKKADIVIDIHSTTSELKDALCITKSDEETMKIVDIVSPKYVLLMNVLKDSVLISDAKVGLVFEYGKNDCPKVLEKTVRDIKKILIYYGMLQGSIEHKEETKIFNVIEQISKPDGFKLLPKIENYKLVKKGETFASNGNYELKADYDFYPILFGNSNYDDIFGFAGIDM